MYPSLETNPKPEVFDPKRNAGPDLNPIPDLIGNNGKTNLSRLLRGVGALTVVAGMCTYLLEGWDTWNGVSRFYVMLGGTSILAVAGLLLSYLLRENKGARAFFGLALVSILVNLTTLAGFIYSTVSGIAAPEAGPNLTGIMSMNWTLGDILDLLLMAASSIVLLTPIAWFAFKILNRPHAGELLLVFAATGSMLLIPVRESLAIALVIIAAFAVPVYYLSSVFLSDPHFKTPEGRFSAATLFMPAVIMLARMMWLYEADALISWILSAILFSATHLLVAVVNENTTLSRLNDIAAIVFAGSVAFFSAVLLNGVVPEFLTAPTAAAVFAGLTRIVSLRGRKTGAGYTALGYLVLVTTSLVSAFATDSLMSYGISVIIGAVLMVVARLEKSVLVFTLGLISIVLSLAPHLIELLEIVDFSNWITLAVLGVTAIVIGSLVEKLGLLGLVGLVKRTTT